jgi:Uncharacterized conserved protein
MSSLKVLRTKLTQLEDENKCLKGELEDQQENVARLQQKRGSATLTAYEEEIKNLKKVGCFHDLYILDFTALSATSSKGLNNC